VDVVAAHHRWSSVVLFALLVLAALAVAPRAEAAEDGARPQVLVVEFVNDVNPVSQDYLTDAIARGEREGVAAVIIELDTPGGLDSSMREIVQRELAATVPIVVYVAPDGARAASAGVFLAMAADVIAMAPQTTIGSSTPIQLGGDDIGDDARRKIVNDAASTLRGLATEHGRNADWAERAVREGANLTAREALDQGVIELIAPDLQSLLTQLDGMETTPKGFVLQTAGAEVERVEMSTWKQVLDVLVNPNVVVLLLGVGALGLLVELLNPGMFLPGGLGAVLLLLGLYGLQVLPVNGAGIALMLLAAALLVAEAFVTSYGALAIAGAVSFAAGALILFDPAGSDYQVSPWLAVPVAAVLAGMAALTITKAVQASRTPPTTGAHELVGQIGVVRQGLAPHGLVFVHGELWQAESPGVPLEAGAEVRVEQVRDDLVLEVRRAAEEPAHDPAATRQEDP
jgi:membrane-bound serine protease (ClpP class)